MANLYVSDQHRIVASALGAPAGTTLRIAAECGIALLMAALPIRLTLDEALVLLAIYQDVRFEPGIELEEAAGNPPRMVERVRSFGMPPKIRVSLEQKLERIGPLGRLALLAKLRLALAAERSGKALAEHVLDAVGVLLHTPD